MHLKQHKVDQSSEYIPTRLFRARSTLTSASVISSNECNLNPLSEPKVFSKNGIQFLGPPPEQSIYGKSQAFTDKLANKNEGNNSPAWITVFCSDMKMKNQIVEYFNSYGEISRVIPPTNNYISLEFVKKSAADAILKEEQPIIVESRTAVVCKPGIYSQKKNENDFDDCPVPHYQTLNEKIQNEITLPQLIHDFFKFIAWNLY
ncbi:hypothetical protein TRFO_15129 [Tritrichomonas foetus]|uniref:RRM Nup35-type domain-containing protein n=1 Tax=Tritrichomonas foetus TaxID=1144522 RepID=A0A1J4KY38_9EUKA|nr:hypothetical protein TRFO_15129 [Tritrichomonas foetus]|eukprot:OHT14477.1 hypothetical protein TRFO_15129 [Tritrichomonas foetus]